ncbi:hypothetical protein HU755_15170 [Pseudomonas sp. SWRI111]|uniref:hypothetical protein n=1 Tax=Pseudomonas sp. SWRI111 TaxID=2745507 RepID=UPI00164469D1|nr:hypothetical protein [Pseudomonas sp. SWRI111]MBC3208143.1 hypothetical protein [Pseudomonas sp. SWRI111]
MPRQSRLPGYFRATKKGVPLFEVDHIEVTNGQYITIEGSKELAFPNQHAIRLTIDSLTPNDDHVFEIGKYLQQVFYLNIGGTQYAQRGTFTSYLDIPNRKYQIDCELDFPGHTDPIKIELDVSG